MENEIVLLNKEQYGLRKAYKEIALTNKILLNAADRLPKEYFEKGEYYFDKGDFKEAINWYNKAIVIKPNFAIAYCKRGYSNFEIDKFYDGIIDFSKAIEIKPDYNDAFYG